MPSERLRKSVLVTQNMLDTIEHLFPGTKFKDYVRDLIDRDLKRRLPPDASPEQLEAKKISNAVADIREAKLALECYSEHIKLTDRAKASLQRAAKLLSADTIRLPPE